MRDPGPGPLYLGIDGGGSGCRARLRDGAGRLLGEGASGPANIYQDPAGALTAIRAAVRSAMAAAGLSDQDLERVHAGMGLAGWLRPVTPTAPDGLDLAFASVHTAVDTHIACLGAHGGADGGIVIAGTGSAGFALVGGKPMSIGGWGFQLGDPGSGAIMGREAVRRMVLALDDLTTWSPLLEAIGGRLGKNQSALAAWAKQARPADYAVLAPIVLASADMDDVHGRSIVGQAAADLGALANRLLALGAPRISLLGGLAQPIFRHMPQAVQERLTPPLADAVDGAILLAQKDHAFGAGSIW